MPRLRTSRRGLRLGNVAEHSVVGRQHANTLDGEADHGVFGDDPIEHLIGGDDLGVGSSHASIAYPFR